MNLRIRYRAYNAGGPGGQKSNKTLNAVEASVELPDGRTIRATSETKSQHRSRKLARALLAAKVREALAPPDPERYAAGRERIRTYHEPDNRVVDHRTGGRWSFRDTVGAGDLATVIDETFQHLALEALRR